MRAPKKVIAAMAMATMIGGTVAPAFAAGFETVVESGVATVKRANTLVDSPDKSIEKGEIRVDGTFTKKINNLPAATKNGHYLRVTMPIALDYEYNLDEDSLQSAKPDIINQSAYITGIAADGSKTGDYKEEDKSVKMSFIGMVDLSETDNQVEYVDSEHQGRDNTAKLPFELKLTTSKGVVERVSLAAIKDANETNPAKSITMGPKTSVSLEVQPIANRVVEDENDILGNSVKSISHNMKLKFEYLG